MEYCKKTSTIQPNSHAPIPHSRPSNWRYLMPALSDLGSTARSSIYSFRERKMDRRPKIPSRNPSRCEMGETMSVRKWDGAARESAAWDGLRRDPELWFPDGNCFVHLYGRGQSRRGPAFRVPFEALLLTNCRPLLDRFLVENLNESPVSDISTNEHSGYFSQQNHQQYNLYIPAPPTAERGQAFLYHMATRNFFAWIFGKSLVGSHLGGALVGLLNSMNEFRSVGEDNVQAIMDYMDEEGYADMRSQPDHALAILFFAEHFHFSDLWTDAFAHCAGMNDILYSYTAFEHISRQSRAFITRSRLEMDMRLDQCGRQLSTFLSDDLSELYLKLSSAARTHMDKFRTFLHTYYVAKLGYYPPVPTVSGGATFPQSIYRQMYSEFQKLYNLLVDANTTSSDAPPISQQGGICILQSLQAFDRRNKYQSLPNPFPLLPEVEDQSTPRTINKRFSWMPKPDKMKADGRLVTFSSLTKATNRKDASLYEYSLVRAYRGFEKACVFSPSKADKNEKLSQTEARKVRWILIYAVLQTLRSATQIPEQVRDKSNVPYNLCVQTAGCPPWKDERPIQSLLRTQTDQSKEDFLNILTMNKNSSATGNITELKPDIDYPVLLHKPQPIRNKSESTLAAFASTRGTVRRAISSLGNMPELHHPRPKRASFHEILVHGYGNGTNPVHFSTPHAASVPLEKSHARNTSSSSNGSSLEGVSSRWSRSSYGEADTPRTSVSSQSYRADTSLDLSCRTINELLDRPMSSVGLRRVPSSVYSASLYDDNLKELQPSPLQTKMRSMPEEDQTMKPEDYDYYMTITSDVRIEYEDMCEGEVPQEISTHISA